jgi:integrative and conjugative element protein (TIGR02256 family)
VRRRWAGQRLILSPALLGQMVTLAWAAWPDETGGILLGQSDEAGARLLALIGPGPAACHAPRHFEPDQPWQEAQVAMAWGRDRSLIYLGDWHTHPDGSPTPSRDDRAVLALIARDRGAAQPHPWMIICAIGPDGSVEPAAFRHSANGRRPTPARVEVRAQD